MASKRDRDGLEHRTIYTSPVGRYWEILKKINIKDINKQICKKYF